MTERLTRDEMLMRVAEIISQRSTCNRLQVGAVIALDGRIISTGYNGAPTGLPHCSPDTCNTGNPCTRTTHAEAGAIAHSARHGVALGGSTLYVTHCPCLDCSKLIINAGLKRIVYRTPYRVVDGLKLLMQAGVEVTYYGN
jgi:dCMP deaminase